MNKLQTVLDALEKIACLGNGDKHGNSVGNVLAIEAIAIVKEMMQSEPVAWINWNAATGVRTVSFEQESELASQPLYYTPVTGDDLAEMTDLKEEREHQRDSAVETIRELVKQRDALRAELGEYPEIQAMLMSENKNLRSEHLSATEPFEKYLKEGETPIQRLEREIKDGRALMTVYGKALAQIQELQQQQDTPVAFYDIAHDEDGDIEYEFSVYPRPGFRPLFAQAIAAAPVAVQAVPADKGPWQAGVNRQDHRVYIQSDDFKHDVRLYVDGDFPTKDAAYLYSCGIARQLNAAAPDVKDRI